MSSGTVAVVTGGTAGIGEAIAAEYVERDAEVVVTDRRERVGAGAAEYRRVGTRTHV